MQLKIHKIENQYPLKNTSIILKIIIIKNKKQELGIKIKNK